MNLKRLMRVKDSSGQFDAFIADVESAFSKAGITPNRSDIRDGFISYTVIFSRKEGSSNLNTGARVGMVFTFADHAEDILMAYVKLSYDDGKRSYNIGVQHRTMRYEIPLGGDKYHVDSLWGNGYDAYLIPYEAGENIIVDGIRKLGYYKGELELALSKSRFTQQAWDKLVDTVAYCFGE